MKRNEFKRIIQYRSVWELGYGNYILPNGEDLSIYVEQLVKQQMKLDKFAISEHGDFYSSSIIDNDIVLLIPFDKNETSKYEEQERRIQQLIYEILNDK